MLACSAVWSVWKRLIASVKSVSGDINVGVVAGTKVWLDVNSMSGDTSSDLDPSDAPAPLPEPTRARVTLTVQAVHARNGSGASGDRLEDVCELLGEAGV